jgi:hypothetical protein
MDFEIFNKKLFDSVHYMYFKRTLFSIFQKQNALTYCKLRLAPLLNYTYIVNYLKFLSKTERSEFLYYEIIFVDFIKK